MPPKAKTPTASEAQQKQDRADARRERNRVAAQRSRDRKVEEFGVLHAENVALQKENRLLKARIKALESGQPLPSSSSGEFAPPKAPNGKRKRGPPSPKDEAEEDELLEEGDSEEQIFDLDEEKPPVEWSGRLDKLPPPATNAVVGRLSSAFAGLKGILGGTSSATQSPAPSQRNSAPPSSESHASFAPPEQFSIASDPIQSGIAAALEKDSKPARTRANSLGSKAKPGPVGKRPRRTTAQ